MSDFNDTLLEKYGLVFYGTNKTLSNSSNCYYIAPVAVEEPIPALYENGTILPAPNLCSDPVRPIKSHGIIGIVSGCIFIISIVLILLNLQRHHNHRQAQTIDGTKLRRHYLLALLAAIVGVITSFVAIDVDREVVSGLPFKLQCIFYSLEQISVLLTMFEATHSWLLRMEYAQNISSNARSTPSGKLDIWLVSCYILMVIAVGLIIVRDWNDLSAQWYPSQTEQIAKVAGTDARFKTGYLIALFCVAGLVFRLISTGARYRKLAKNEAMLPYRERFLRSTLMIFLCIWIAGYNAASSFIWHVSPYNISVSQRYYYCGGILPCVTALILLHSAGIVGSRGESGIVNVATGIMGKDNDMKKPRWWRHSRHYTSEDDTIPLTLHDLKHVRGRDEKYEDAGSWWPWERDNNIDNSAGSDHGFEQSPLELGRIVEEQRDTSTPELDNYGSNSTRVSGLRQPTSANTKSRHKQALVKSMLDI